MSARNRWLSTLGVAVLAAGASAFVASPAEAAPTGVARVKNATEVEFTAGSGKTNAVTVTRSGRTITIDDRVAVKAGRGCKAVRGDGEDLLYGNIGDDRIYGEADDDYMIGIHPYGSDDDADMLDGGANSTDLGDHCAVGPAGSTVDCERP